MIGTSDSLAGIKTGSITSSKVLRPELVLQTLVTGPEMTVLDQTGTGTLDSGPV